MKNLVFLVVLLFVKAEFSTAQRSGRALTLPKDICAADEKADIAKCVIIKDGVVAASAATDCPTDFVTCSGVVDVGALTSCPGSLPNCVQSNQTVFDATCEAEKSPTCVSPASPYDCVQAGVFPDPRNCKNYFTCTPILPVKSTDPVTYELEVESCPPSYVFDPTSPPKAMKYCRFTTIPSQCIQLKTTDCPANSVDNILLKYPLTFRGVYVASCRRVGAPLVWRCASGTTPDFDTRQCKPTCTTEATYEYIGDPKKYFYCVRNTSGIGWNVLVESCKEGEVYNLESKTCAKPE